MLPRNEIRRARPLLGTFVEITARGLDDEQLNRAVDDAFDAVELAHNLMSWHLASSDLTRLNREALRAPVEVHDWTFAVLQAAAELSNKSDGAFDVTIGAELMLRGMLPKLVDFSPHAGGSYEQIELLPGNRVKFLAPILLDLGGIAKGFAVDRAVAVLEVHECSSALVNAGGDLRAFGDRKEIISVRLPEDPTAVRPLFEIQCEAVATSVTAASYRSELAGALYNGTTRLPIEDRASYTVRASSCMIADALTKVVAVSDSDCASLLAQYGASAYKISGGEVYALEN